jgi:hypothetical protein
MIATAALKILLVFEGLLAPGIFGIRSVTSVRSDIFSVR